MPISIICPFCGRNMMFHGVSEGYGDYAVVYEDGALTGSEHDMSIAAIIPTPPDVAERGDSYGMWCFECHASVPEVLRDKFHDSNDWETPPVEVGKNTNTPGWEG